MGNTHVLVGMLITTTYDPVEYGHQTLFSLSKHDVPDICASMYSSYRATVPQQVHGKALEEL